MPVYSRDVVDPQMLEMWGREVATVVNHNAAILDQQNAFYNWLVQTHPEVVREYVTSTAVARRLEGEQRDEVVQG